MGVSVAVSQFGWSKPDAAGTASFDLVRLRGLMEASEGASQIVVGLIDGPVAVEHPSLAAKRIRVAAGNDGAVAPRPRGLPAATGPL